MATVTTGFLCVFEARGVVTIDSRSPFQLVVGTHPPAATTDAGRTPLETLLTGLEDGWTSGGRVAAAALSLRDTAVKAAALPVG